jgi:C-terminal processing protease CtpA/Prc
VFADADARTVTGLAINLRNNRGGNEPMIGPLKSGLAARPKSVGPFHVLIGAGTFSSAVINAQQLHNSLSATLVGENSGGMPPAYSRSLGQGRQLRAKKMLRLPGCSPRAAR